MLTIMSAAPDRRTSEIASCAPTKMPLTLRWARLLVLHRLTCTEEGQLALQSYVWPDQVERFRQPAAAIEVARRVPAEVDQANAADWVKAALANHVSGVATVVYHSIVWQYLSNEDRARLKRVMAAAGQAATHDNPLAWLRLEPADNVAEVRLPLWPGSEDQLLARCGFHGKPVQWLGREN